MKNHWVKVWDIPWTTKAIELEAHDRKQGGSDKIDVWNLRVRRKRKIDHAGTEFEFEGTERIYGFRFYDQRHWDHEKNQFYD